MIREKNAVEGRGATRSRQRDEEGTFFHLMSGLCYLRGCHATEFARDKARALVLKDLPRHTTRNTPAREGVRFHVSGHIVEYQHLATSCSVQTSEIICMRQKNARNRKVKLCSGCHITLAL